MDNLDKQFIFVVGVFFFMMLVAAALASVVVASWYPILIFLTASGIVGGMFAGIHGVCKIAEKLFPDD